MPSSQCTSPWSRRPDSLCVKVYSPPPKNGLASPMPLPCVHLLGWLHHTSLHHGDIHRLFCFSPVSPSKLGSTSPGPAPLSKAATKPTYLSLLSSVSKLSPHDASSPGSPNVMVTPADHPLSQYDSGKDSMTCSDASGHSNYSESQPANMIELDSPVHASLATKLIPGVPADYVPEFDPLIRQSISHDSLFDSKYATSTSSQAFSASPTPTPTHHHYQHRTSLEGSYEGSSGSSGIWMSSSTNQSNHQYGSQTSTSPKGL